MKINIIDMEKYPSEKLINAHGKGFKIERTVWTHNLNEICDLTYVIYIRKKFLFWEYWSMIWGKPSNPDNHKVLEFETIEKAEKFIRTVYPLIKKVNYYVKVDRSWF